MATGRVLETVVERWDRWVVSLEGVRTRRDWSRCETLRGWGASELRSPCSSERTDAMQASLVSLAQAADHDAATTIITQMRPGLGSLARRVAATDSRFGSLDDATSEVLSVFGERVMAHRLDRRPRKIAANLLLDTRQQIWRAGTREARISEAALAAAATAGDAAIGHGPDAVADELDVVAAVTAALQRMPGTGRSRRLTAELAYRTWILEEPSAAVAHDLGLGREAASSRLYRLRSIVRLQLDDVGCGDQPPSRRSPGSAPSSSPVGPAAARRQ